MYRLTKSCCLTIECNSSGLLAQLILSRSLITSTHTNVCCVCTRAKVTDTGCQYILHMCSCGWMLTTHTLQMFTLSRDKRQNSKSRQSNVAATLRYFFCFWYSQRMDEERRWSLSRGVMWINLSVDVSCTIDAYTDQTLLFSYPDL